MSRTWKDRRDYKSRKKVKHSTYQFYNRGGYDDYDHSDEELYVYDQCCENCRFYRNCCHTPFSSGWCEYWKDGRY